MKSFYPKKSYKTQGEPSTCTYSASQKYVMKFVIPDTFRKEKNAQTGRLIFLYVTHLHPLIYTGDSCVFSITTRNMEDLILYSKKIDEELYFENPFHFV